MPFWEGVAYVCLVGEQTRFAVYRCHMTNQPPLSSIVNLSSLVVFLSFDILWEWMRMQTPAKSFLSLLLRAGDVHLGGHGLPEWRPSKAISLPWIWSCIKPENWLRIDLSGDWCLYVVLCTCSGACYYWIGLVSTNVMCVSYARYLNKKVHKTTTYVDRRSTRLFPLL